MAAKRHSPKADRGRKSSPEPGQEPEWRIILTGKSGGGKSATGNTILGREEFPSTLSAKSTTQDCYAATGKWNGYKFRLIDTPAIFDSKTPGKRNKRKQCVELSRPGPHALLFVTQVGNFTAEDEAAAKRVLKAFGKKAKENMIILFTRKEDLGRISLEDYVEQSGNEALRKLVANCGNRVCAFNNRAVGAERGEQVSQLMGMVQEVVRENGGSHYSSRSAMQRAARRALSMTPLAGAVALVRLFTAVTVFIAVLAMALCRLLADILSYLKKWAADTLSWLYHKCCILIYPIPFFKKPNGHVSGDRVHR